MEAHGNVDHLFQPQLMIQQSVPPRTNHLCPQSRVLTRACQCVLLSLGRISIPFLKVFAITAWAFAFRWSLGWVGTIILRGHWAYLWVHWPCLVSKVLSQVQSREETIIFSACMWCCLADHASSSPCHTPEEVLCNGEHGCYSSIDELVTKFQLLTPPWTEEY